MMHTAQALYDELNATHLELNKQIAQVKEDLEASFADSPYPELRSIYKQRTRDGGYVMAELLTTKAKLLSAMAMLKASTSSAGPGRGKW